MIRVFAGYDDRERLGFHVFLSSLIKHSSEPFSVTPLSGDQRDGTNSFTYARFRVPELCKHKGWALFCDGSDMLVRADIAQLWALRDPTNAVQVVKHDYTTQHPKKYVGTPLEADNSDYPRKNWSSLVLWNMEHPANQPFKGMDINKLPGAYLHRFSWLADEEIGEIPLEWNHLVGEYPENPNAKIAHFTLGIPAFSHYKDSEFSHEWWEQLK